jgi:hypothetical protein
VSVQPQQDLRSFIIIIFIIDHSWPCWLRGIAAEFCVLLPLVGFLFCMLRGHSFTGIDPVGIDIDGGTEVVGGSLKTLATNFAA